MSDEKIHDTSCMGLSAKGKAFVYRQIQFLRLRLCQNASQNTETQVNILYSDH